MANVQRPNIGAGTPPNFYVTSLSSWLEIGRSGQHKNKRSESNGYFTSNETTP